MSPRLLPFSQVIEQERRRWVPFRRALSMEDQEACDRMCACATQPLQAEVEMGRPWRFEAKPSSLPGLRSVRPPGSTIGTDRR